MEVAVIVIIYVIAIVLVQRVIVIVIVMIALLTSVAGRKDFSVPSVQHVIAILITCANHALPEIAATVTKTMRSYKVVKLLVENHVANVQITVQRGVHYAKIVVRTVGAIHVRIVYHKSAPNAVNKMPIRSYNARIGALTLGMGVVKPAKTAKILARTINAVAIAVRIVIRAAIAIVLCPLALTTVARVVVKTAKCHAVIAATIYTVRCPTVIAVPTVTVLAMDAKPAIRSYVVNVKSMFPKIIIKLFTCNTSHPPPDSITV